jgi:hypothetical protein
LLVTGLDHRKRLGCPTGSGSSDATSMTRSLPCFTHLTQACPSLSTKPTVPTYLISISRVEHHYQAPF